MGVRVLGRVGTINELFKERTNFKRYFERADEKKEGTKLFGTSGGKGIFLLFLGLFSLAHDHSSASITVTLLHRARSHLFRIFILYFASLYLF